MKPTNFPIALALVATIAAASALIPIGDTVAPYQATPGAPDPREGRVDASVADAEMLMGVIEREKMAQPTAQRMCEDLRDESVRNGNIDAFAVLIKHCPLREEPAPVVRRARVVLDTVQVEKAQDCDGLRAKAYDRDPVAAYDLVQLQKAGLCVR